jgi:hypothetical protein
MGWKYGFCIFPSFSQYCILLSYLNLVYVDFTENANCWNGTQCKSAPYINTYFWKSTFVVTESSLYLKLSTVTGLKRHLHFHILWVLEKCTLINNFVCSIPIYRHCLPSAVGGLFKDICSIREIVFLRNQLCVSVWGNTGGLDCPTFISLYHCVALR